MFARTHTQERMHARTHTHKRAYRVDSCICFQENDSKRARAIKKANDEREMKKAKDREIERCVDC